MGLLIAALGVANLMLAILLFVASIARMDRRYAARVRAEHDRKSLLRGRRDDNDVL